MDKIKVFIWGINGKMGRVLCESIAAQPRFVLDGGFDIACDSERKVFNKVSDINVQPDVVIDFSRPSSLSEISEFVLERKIPLVLATTGYDDGEQAQIEALSKRIAVFKSGNMSVGVNVLLDLVEAAARALSGFDIEIVEAHHNQKVDAPSGTALMLARAANFDGSKTIVSSREGARKPQEIGVHALRGGTINGEHSVVFAGSDEVITLSHSALSRKIFANGALRAAELILAKKAGLYSFKNINN